MKLPLIPINHIEAHILANFIDKFQVPGFKFQELFPAICLIVSGGHTQLILIKGIGKYKILGETRDDAAGECFDKAARILGLGYPGGPAIAEQARRFVRDRISNRFLSLPRPMIYQKNYDFSFSGLKTAVLYHDKNQPEKIRKSILRRGSGLTLSEIEASKKYKQAMATEVQQAIIDVLIHKTLKAAKDYQVKSIMLGGGVAANNELRKQFKSEVKSPTSGVGYFFVPAKKFCTDNAAMVAVASYYHWIGGRKYNLEKIEAKANLRL